MSLHVYEEVEQRSDEWWSLRCGLVTASVIGALISHTSPNAIDVACPACDASTANPCHSKRTGAEIKTLHPERAEKARNEPPVLVIADDKTIRQLAGSLAAERITGSVDPDGSLGGRDIWRGIISEPYATDAYAEHAGTPVIPCGFMTRDFGDVTIGVSPDGLVGEEGGVEVKSPRRKGHVLTVADGEVPPAHIAQIQTALLVSDRAWWDFISFAGGMRLWVKRVYPDPEWHAAIISAANLVEDAIDQIVADYETATNGFPTTEALPDNDLGLVF